MLAFGQAQGPLAGCLHLTSPSPALWLTLPCPHPPLLQVLSQLDGALREAGTSREHLVQVTVSALLRLHPRACCVQAAHEQQEPSAPAWLGLALPSPALPTAPITPPSPRLQALLKDLPMGREAFAAAWNAWVPPAALPALAVLESYLGREDLCVSVHAVAAVPSRPAYT